MKTVEQITIEVSRKREQMLATVREFYDSAHELVSGIEPEDYAKAWDQVANAFGDIAFHALCFRHEALCRLGWANVIIARKAKETPPARHSREEER